VKPESIIKLVKEKTEQYGIVINWNASEAAVNSRGRSVLNNNGEVKSAKVLLLKEKFAPLKIIDANTIGLSQDYARYLLTLPEVEIKKDMVITDNHDRKWKLGFIDWFDISGVPVCKQTTLTEVE